MTPLLLIWLLIVPPAGPGDDVEKAVSSVYERGSYQSELPGVNAPEIEKRKPRQPESVPFDDRAGSEERLRDRSTDTLIGEIVRGLFWIVVIVIAVFLIVWLVREIPRRGYRAQTAAAAATPVAAPVAEEESRLPPEEYAAAGRFGEAIHALLLGILIQLGDRLPPAWTSREALRRFKWPEAAREPMMRLVGRVERIEFGGAVAAEVDYRGAVEDAGAVQGHLNVKVVRS